APATVLVLHGMFGWRGAFLGSAMLGVIAALVLIFQPDGEPHPAAAKPRDAGSAQADWRLLVTAPILMNFVFFLLYAFSSFGLQNFSVVALGSLDGTSPVTANTALSAYLLLSAGGVLVGGWLAGRISRHRLIASFGLFATVLAALLMGGVDLGAL